MALSIVRTNLLTQKGYAPYCGDPKCKAGMPRAAWDGEQFNCRCGWRSEFDKEFIDTYKATWGKGDKP